MRREVTHRPRAIHLHKHPCAQRALKLLQNFEEEKKMKTILLVGLLLVISIAPNAKADWQDGRIAWYSFNGGYGDSVNGYNATNYNTTLTTDSSGNPNSACLFSNYMDRVELPYEVLDGKNDFTVFAQIKVSQSIAIMPTIVSGANYSNAWGNEALFCYNGEHGGWETYVHEIPVTFSSSLIYDQWMNMAWVRDSVAGESRIYINGNLMLASAASGGSISIASGGLWLGLDQDNVGGGWTGGDQFYGSMDNVMFWDRALSTTEVASILKPAILLLPNGGESWIAGTQQTIQWQNPNPGIANVKIEYSTNNGADWNDVNSSTPNDESYDWLVPQVTSNQCLVRISDANDANSFDTSDNTFTIFECRLNSKADLDGNCKVDLTDFALFANDWLRNGNPFDEGYTEPLPIIWVYVNDPGVSGYEGFTGYMSKYETTNAQYCQFLNAALASGDITIDGNDAKGASGSNSGEDFVGELYYNLAGLGFTYNGATNGVAARINYSGGIFSVDSGFENHPVTYVSWYGATAFCNYYGYRLPTVWEWQAVADYDGSYTYGCGTSINNSIANYLGSNHPDGTTVVGAFGTYGYGMCDMAGNALEWTSILFNPEDFTHILSGGSWSNSNNECQIGTLFVGYSYACEDAVSFRVCR
jgi:hypothetical protein